ncbi:MAG TPA: dihydrofolate reductase family protein [Acidimicrobiales bacterium]|nr:dihydrofolate reductase family protein [Acidimicrobiales bacterium]
MTASSVSSRTRTARITTTTPTSSTTRRHHTPDLVYTANISIDGYTEDSDGRLDWSNPEAEIFSFIRELERPAGTYLYGRRMYEAMVYWETAAPDEGYIREFAEMWRQAAKVVYSHTLESPSSARTTLERDFDPEAVRRLKATVTRRLTIGGANLAGQALAAGLVDEIRLLVVPVILGGGKPWAPHGVRRPLQLVETHHFASGVVYLRYRVDTGN